MTAVRRRADNGVDPPEETSMTAPAEPTAPLPAAATIEATVSALDRAAVHAKAHLAALDEAPVRPTASLETLRARFVRPLPDEGLDPAAVVDELAANAEGGLVRSAGPRYFGFVIGGSVPAALAADWLTSAWDQNAGLYVIGPAAAVAEETAGAWLIDLFGLPETASVGYTTGATMASFTGLAAGRHALLAKAGWDVERQGLFGAPEIPVVVSDESHVTIFAALQMLGMGRDRVHPRPHRRPGPDAPRGAGGRPRATSTGRRSSPPRRATSTPARSTRCRRSSRPSARTAAGSTSTARSGCGPPPIPRGATSSTGWGTPTRGRPTPTSGSTCRTTRGCRSCATRPPTTRR